MCPLSRLTSPCRTRAHNGNHRRFNGSTDVLYEDFERKRVRRVRHGHRRRCCGKKVLDHECPTQAYSLEVTSLWLSSRNEIGRTNHRINFRLTSLKTNIYRMFSNPASEVWTVNATSIPSPDWRAPGSGISRPMGDNGRMEFITVHDVAPTNSRTCQHQYQEKSKLQKC